MATLLASTLVMVHGSKLVDKVFEELNASQKVLTKEDFESIIEENKKRDKQNEDSRR